MKPDQLLNLFTSHFNMIELEGLCFDLGVKHEEIPGHNRTLSAFARNLILFFWDKDRLPTLIERCRELRPEASWPDNDSLLDFSTWTGVAIDDKELENYLGWVQTQYNTMRVLSMTQSLSLETVYTDVILLDKSKEWQKQGIDELEKAFAEREGLGQGEKRIQGGELLAQANRFFIEGHPGAGKTTFSKWLALQAAQIYEPRQKIPVYLALRRFNTWDEDLLALLAHELELGGITASLEKMKGLLQQGILLILLDGLDEVLAEQRDALNDQIDELAKWGDENQIVITCRPHAETRQFEHFDYVQMANFTKEQVDHFVRHWFDNRKLANELLNDLQKSEHESIRELTRTPLLLALLCLSYQTEPTFPKRKDELYERALQVVLQQWDEERGVKRESIYGQLSLEKKQALLAYVAYTTFAQGQLFVAESDLAQHIDDFWQNWRQEEIERQKTEYGQIYPPELPPKEIVSQKIIREIVAQHGLLVEQLEGVYSFSHLTLQEYFAALYVARNEIQMIPRLVLHVHDDRWREVFLLTSGMVYDATHFCTIFAYRLAYMAAVDEAMLSMVQWLARQSPVVQGGVQPSAIRALLVFLDIVLNLDVEPDSFDLPVDEVIDLYDLIDDNGVFTLNLALDLALDLDSNLVLDRDRILAIVMNIATASAFSLELDDSLILTLAVFYDHALLTNSSLIAHLRAWQACQWREDLPAWLQAALSQLIRLSEKADSREWGIFDQQIEAILSRILGQEQFWGLSEEQQCLFADYLVGTQLLVNCLDVATVDREAIEAMLLLPPEVLLTDEVTQHLHRCVWQKTHLAQLYKSDYDR